MACSEKYYMTRTVSLFIINADDNTIEMNQEVINELSAETVMNNDIDSGCVNDY